VYLVPKHLRPEIDDRLYNRIIWVKRGAELSTDHHLVVSWIRWRGSQPERPGKPKRVVQVKWERLVEDPVREVFNSHLRMNFSHIPREVGDMQSG